MGKALHLPWEWRLSYMSHLEIETTVLPLLGKGPHMMQPWEMELEVSLKSGRVMELLVGMAELAMSEHSQRLGMHPAMVPRVETQQVLLQTVLRLVMQQVSFQSVMGLAKSQPFRTPLQVGNSPAKASP